MNKIVRDHYPVENLPSDLRNGLEDQTTVRIVIEVEAQTTTDTETGSGIKELRTVADTLDMIRKYKAEQRPSVSAQEAVDRIRALREEWDN